MFLKTFSFSISDIIKSSSSRDVNGDQDAGAEAPSGAPLLRRWASRGAAGRGPGLGARAPGAEAPGGPGAGSHRRAPLGAPCPAP